MTTRTVTAFASLGPYELGDVPSPAAMFLFCGAASPESLACYQFRFIDGQQPAPGARGVVQMTFPQGQLPPTSGPLPVWAGKIIGHIWGLRLG